MKTRTRRALGAAAAAAAMVVSLPVAGTAYADPPTEAEAVAKTPDPQGPGCDAFKQQVPNFKSLSRIPVGMALASIPDISTFNSAVSGQLNPEVNIVGVLNNGPYVVFAPSNEAFAKLPPEQLEALKSDPAALTDLVYYHAFLGVLGPDQVNGQWPTQQGTQVLVTGQGGDVMVNGTAKVVCGGITASNAKIYIIDQVLNMADAPAPIAPQAPVEVPGEAPAATDVAPAEAPEAEPAAEASDAETPVTQPAES